MSKWIIAALAVAVLGIGGAFAFWNHDDDWGPNRGGEVVTRSIAADGTETIIVREGNHRFFPFGFFIFPLVLFFTVFAFRGLAFRGHSAGYGPWIGGGPGANEPPGWFDDWHRRAHTGSNLPQVANDQKPTT